MTRAAGEWRHEATRKLLNAQLAEQHPGKAVQGGTQQPCPTAQPKRVLRERVRAIRRERTQSGVSFVLQAYASVIDSGAGLRHLKALPHQQLLAQQATRCNVRSGRK